jgi:hypothetical protein
VTVYQKHGRNSCTFSNDLFETAQPIRLNVTVLLDVISFDLIPIQYVLEKPIGSVLKISEDSRSRFHQNTGKTALD